MFREIIQNREQNNIRLEADADQALLRNKRGMRLESPIDDAQTARARRAKQHATVHGTAPTTYENN